MYNSGPTIGENLATDDLKGKIFSIVDPLKYTRFYKVREKKLVYFSGSQKRKIFVLKDKNVREKKLMYFIFPNFGPLKYIRCEKLTLSTKVH